MGTKGFTFEGPFYLNRRGQMIGWDEQEAEHVIYAHCHGEHRFHDSILGEKNGIQYHLVSGDYLRWVPETIMD